MLSVSKSVKSVKETTQKIQHPGLIRSDSERLVMRLGSDTQTERDGKREIEMEGERWRQMETKTEKDREACIYARCRWLSPLLTNRELVF